MDAEKGLSHDLSSLLDLLPVLAPIDAETPLTIAGFGIPLYPYREVPSFLRGNPYITEGYRAYLSNEMCIKRYVLR